MKTASQVLFWLGIVCIPLAWLMWYMGPQLELARYVMADIADPASPLGRIFLLAVDSA